MGSIIVIEAIYLERVQSVVQMATMNLRITTQDINVCDGKSRDSIFLMFSILFTMQTLKHK